MFQLLRYILAVHMPFYNAPPVRAHLKLACVAKETNSFYITFDYITVSSRDCNLVVQALSLGFNPTVQTLQKRSGGSAAFV